mmetsp:Transcript_2588/g.6014  ORF Transcript_2588/g.6014 Transcript_2588/m.6014 type:complete len:242 (+) Transcript_2588:594-1319(+)
MDRILRSPLATMAPISSSSGGGLGTLWRRAVSSVSTKLALTPCLWQKASTVALRSAPSCRVRFCLGMCEPRSTSREASRGVICALSRSCSMNNTCSASLTSASTRSRALSCSWKGMEPLARAASCSTRNANALCRSRFSLALSCTAATVTGPMSAPSPCPCSAWVRMRSSSVSRVGYAASSPSTDPRSASTTLCSLRALMAVKLRNSTLEQLSSHTRASLGQNTCTSDSFMRCTRIAHNSS